MRMLRAALAGALIGFIATVGALPPASASAAGSAPVVDMRSDVMPVIGEPWSEPAYPVNCRASSGQVTCTPDDATLVKPQQCFLGVLVQGERSTICTTYEEHVDAIKAVGGKALVVEYGCSLGDVVCLTFENAGRGMAITATGAMYAVASNMRFDTSSLLWSAATEEWSFWQWAVLMILFGAMVWAIAAAAISGDRGELVGAIVRSFIAVAAVPLTLWLTGHLLNAIDDLTWYVMSREGPASLFSTLQSVMWAGGQANYFFAFLIHGLLLFSMLLLMVVFAFRNIVLAALIAVGPIAWMIFPVRGIGPQWVVRYASAVVVLLLTGPLTIGFVTLIINGLAAVNTIWDPQSWPLLVGLVLVAFAPFAIFGLFSFVGAVAADGVGSRLGSGAAHMAGNAGRSAMRIPTRLGAMPAGVPSGAGRGSASNSAGVASTARASTTTGLRGPGTPASRTSPPPTPGPQRSAAPTSTAAPQASSPTPSPRSDRSTP
ncbi:hypothetical protein [Microbacterium sp. 2FI]|uniref:hypothetical protein n=1 Tax=Microbacterium sp. 2FI TaxID=2502193 RepID=UPI0010F4D7E2|nr:hypothetical protein [Microbacterium sp. 2FI]